MMLKTLLCRSPWVCLLLVLLAAACDHPVTEPEKPEEHLVTFRGRAYLAGQPAPVNALDLPLDYDIQIISFLPGDSASYDTTYTDSSGVYTSTRLRWDGAYKLVSRFPYYSSDTVEVAVREGEVDGEVPRLFSQRLERIQIFADSSVYHSLWSGMFFTEYITNFSMTDTIGAPTTLQQILVRKDDLDKFYFAGDPNISYSLPLKPLEVQVRYQSRSVAQFVAPRNLETPGSGSYYLYAAGESWGGAGALYFHYAGRRDWWFKIIEPAEIELDLEP